MWIWKETAWKFSDLTLGVDLIIIVIFIEQGSLNKVKPHLTYNLAVIYTVIPPLWLRFLLEDLIYYDCLPPHSNGDGERKRIHSKWFWCEIDIYDSKIIIKVGCKGKCVNNKYIENLNSFLNI